eukprot:CAMPEP_0196717552 /NCGR_PEP_ID=MMETSP1091-20130531/909_1 /TAXON_ID=302021 /ORGANISM="Rhodomonas sp., Strain CCMP768" /LENGTH=139 /DNA_ID=CAMNT_0042057919 /DNA_START=10 /DNA_END=429 /DNA_ORIENTATION=-
MVMVANSALYMAITQTRNSTVVSERSESPASHRSRTSEEESTMTLSSSRGMRRSNSDPNMSLSSMAADTPLSSRRSSTVINPPRSIMKRSNSEGNLADELDSALSFPFAALTRAFASASVSPQNHVRFAKEVDCCEFES